MVNYNTIQPMRDYDLWSDEITKDYLNVHNLLFSGRESMKSKKKSKTEK